jgi:hypothetical protein
VCPTTVGCCRCRALRLAIATTSSLALLEQPPLEKIVLTGTVSKVLTPCLSHSALPRPPQFPPLCPCVECLPTTILPCGVHLYKRSPSISCPPPTTRFITDKLATVISPVSPSAHLTALPLSCAGHRAPLCFEEALRADVIDSHSSKPCHTAAGAPSLVS